MVIDENQKLRLIYQLDCIKFIEDIIAPMYSPPLQIKPFHKEWIKLFEENRFVSLLAPRGSGKSFMVAFYIIWKIVTNPKIRILILTINQDMADSTMMLIQRHLENNGKLKEIFGSGPTGNRTLKGYSDWSRSTLRVLGAGNQKDPTLKVAGITGGYIGGHHNMIILDDIMDANNSKTEYQRKNVFSTIDNTIMPMLEPPQGKLISISTKWHDNDVGDYLGKTPGFIAKKYISIIKEPTETESAEVLWSERFSYEELQRIKQKIRSLAFEMQYQNNIISVADSPIKKEWIEASIEGYKLPSTSLPTYMGVDFASKGKDSDYFAVTVIGVVEGKIYVLDGIHTQDASMFRQFEIIRSLNNKWQPVRIGLEQAAQQKMIVDQLIESTPMPIMPIKSSIVNDHMTRIQRLSVLFETGRIFINPNEDKLQPLIDEAIIYPHGSGEDYLDSLSFAIQASQFMDEEKHINWDDASNMIITKKNEDSVKPVSQDRYHYIKI